MSDLFEEPQAHGNNPEFSVTELSGAIKRALEGEFGLVRVRGEIGRVSRPSSGHVYFDLKDDRAVIAAVSWKGQVARMQTRPEEGMEVVATGRLTTFPGQSKYQLIVEDIAPAGAGALMAMLERRRAALQAEGLFDPARKKPLPWLPQVIGVVTSPSGAVIRDILHRLRDRFPRHVLVWPVAVQGERCAAEVAAAIAGFNAIAPGGLIPRPDLLIVARGGGSLEDLWGFNEEIVVRAAAASQIPLISAVGHETDTTLIDYASDRRAPTPTAAAEMAVPVRFELLGALDGLSARMVQGVAQGVGRRGQRLRDLGRALPRPETLLQSAEQRFDWWSGRLAGGLMMLVSRRRAELERAGAPMRPRLLGDLLARRSLQLESRAEQLSRLGGLAQERRAGALEALSRRLETAHGAVFRMAEQKITRERGRVEELSARLQRGFGEGIARRGRALEGLERMHASLGYNATLARGFAVVRNLDGGVVTSAVAAEGLAQMVVQFGDGRVTVAPSGAGAAAVAPAPAAPKTRTRAVKAEPNANDSDDQGSLF